MAYFPQCTILSNINYMSVPADALFPHPDGVAPPLEVEVGVLLPAPVDVLRLLTHNLSPEPEQISVEVKAYDFNSLLHDSNCSSVSLRA